jgi:hypothetical protein
MAAQLTVLIDARNVLRSKWPNIPEDKLVELARSWAAEHGHRAVIVFDGRGPSAPDVVGTGRESADDWLPARPRDWPRPASRSGSSPPTASCGIAQAAAPSG